MNTGKAIGIVETNSVPRGILVTDEMVKRASVAVVESCPLCPGKYFTMVSGLVDDVRAAVERGRETAGAYLVDVIIIPDVHSDVLAAISRSTRVESIDALGILETHAMATAVEAADAIAKAAAVTLIELRLSRCLGGKSFISFTGDVASVNSAARRGEELARGRGQLVNSVVISRPHEKLHPFII